RTFSAISSGTLTLTVSPLWLESMTRTCSHRSEVLEDGEFTVTSWAREAGARVAIGASSRGGARAIGGGRGVRCVGNIIKIPPSGTAGIRTRQGQNARFLNQVRKVEPKSSGIVSGGGL